MATITGYGSKHSHEFKLTVNETSTSVANNTSEISFSFTIYKASYSWSNWNSVTYSISINGTSYTGTIPSYSAGSTMTIRTGAQTISHNSDGTKSINYSFSVTDNTGQSYTCGNASASGTLALTTIPRYADINSAYVESTGLNTAVIKYSVSRSANIYCSVDNQAWGNPRVSNTTSGTFTITNLTPNVKHSFKILAKATASGLDRTSGIFYGTTKDIAKLSSVPNINIGNSHTITWSNPSGAATALKLCKTDGTQVINYGTVTGTSKTVTPTASTIYALTPNSNAITLRYIITTTSNGTSYTNYKDCIFTVTNSNPTFSNFSYQDTNSKTIGLTGNNQILIKGYSNVKGTISTANKAAAKNSATMKSYKMLIGSKNITANYNSNADVNLTINAIDNNVIDMYAIDSRGNSTKVSKNVTIKNYSNIKIVSVQAIRENNIGQAVTLKFEAQFWNASFGSVTNAITSCIYKYKNTSSSTYVDGKTVLTYTISGNKITGNINIKGDLEAEGFDISNSYNIQLILSDRLSTSTYTITLGSGNPAIAVYKNNVAIGQKYDTNDESKLQVNGNLNIKADGTNVAYKQGGVPILRYSGTDTILASSNGRNIYLRPNGHTNITGQIQIYNNGTMEAPVIRSKLESTYGRITNANIPHTYENDRAHVQLLLATSSMTSNKPANDGYILHFSWDNSGQWNEQLFLPNGATSPLQYRSCSNGTWGSWENIYRTKTLYDNGSGTNGTVNLSESSTNFKYLEIFYAKGTSSDLCSSIRINVVNGKKFSFTWSQYLDTWAQMEIGYATISGSTITRDGSKNGGVNLAGSGVTIFTADELKIYKVVGYR